MTEWKTLAEVWEEAGEKSCLVYSQTATGSIIQLFVIGPSYYGAIDDFTARKIDENNSVMFSKPYSGWGGSARCFSLHKPKVKIKVKMWPALLISQNGGARITNQLYSEQDNIKYSNFVRLVKEYPAIEVEIDE